MSTQEIKGVEIFAVGKWNQNVFSSDDLDSIVDSFHALGFSGKVPLKLGHEDPRGGVQATKRDKDGKLKDPMDQLSMGWVTNIYRDGNKILADIEVPDKVYELIEGKYLRFVSVELFREVRTSRRVFPWVLDAVALLGTDPPAVGVLKDIMTLSALDRTEFSSFTQVATFSRADENQSTSIGVQHVMADEKDKDKALSLESLSAKLIEMSAQISALTEVNTKQKVEIAEGKATAAQFAALQVKMKNKEIEEHRNMIKGKLENAVKSEDLTPASRDRFLRMFKVEVDTEDAQDAMLEITAPDVDNYIKENPNPKKKASNKRQTFSVQSVTDDLPENIEPDQGMVALMFAQLKADGINKPTQADMEAATIKVMRANPEAAQRYQTQQNEVYGRG